MKPHRTWFFGILLPLLFVSVPVLAQVPASGEADDLRGLKPNWMSRKVDGIQVKIRKALHPKNKDSEFRLVDPEQVFKSGDRIRFEFESNFTGYLYLINIMPSGEKEVIFPRPGLSNSVKAFQPYTFPPAEDFIFDNEVGTEIVQWVLSRIRIPILDQAAYEKEGRLKALPEKVIPATVVQVGIVGDGVKVEAGDFEARGVLVAKESNGATIVAIKRRPTHKDNTAPKKTPASTTRARSMTIAPQSAPPSPPPSETTEGQLGDKEVLVFEVRLKHQ
jgi:hypothetical protein